MTLLKPLFLAASPKCEHSISFGLEENDCWLCEFIQDVLQTTPPFDLKCIDNIGINLKKDAVYTVGLVVREGIDTKGRTAGVLLTTADGSLTSTLYDITKFSWSNPKNV